MIEALGALNHIEPISSKFLLIWGEHVYLDVDMRGGMTSNRQGGRWSVVPFSLNGFLTKLSGVYGGYITISHIYIYIPNIYIIYWYLLWIYQTYPYIYNNSWMGLTDLPDCEKGHFCEVVSGSTPQACSPMWWCIPYPCDASFQSKNSWWLFILIR
jgi:hypothetical protein